MDSQGRSDQPLSEITQPIPRCVVERPRLSGAAPGSLTEA